MWFDSWSDLGRILVVAPLVYGALVATLRVTGKRTLSKLNAFDLVVTVALGSTLATVLLNADVSISEGLVALVALVLLQYGVSWASARSRRVERAIKAEPTLVYHRGFLDEALRRERVTPEEVRQAARAQGQSSMERVTAVVLETDGTFSVLTETPSTLGER